MLVFLFVMTAVLLFPSVAAENVRQTLNVWSFSVVPTLFPVMVASSWMTAHGRVDRMTRPLRPLMRLLNLPEDAAYPFLISLLCGYPVGSRTVSFMDSQHPGYRGCAALCCTSGPAFVLITVGTAFLHDPSAGLRLLTVHYAAHLIFSQFFSFKTPKGNIWEIKTAIQADVIGDSASAVIRIAGYMVTFSLFACFLTLPIKNETVAMCLRGMIEFSTGIREAARLKDLPLIAFFLSFGGFSVIFQCLSFVKISPLRFILWRFCEALIAFALMLLCEKTASIVWPIMPAIAAVLGKKLFKKTGLIS